VVRSPERDSTERGKLLFGQLWIAFLNGTRKIASRHNALESPNALCLIAGLAVLGVVYDGSDECAPVHIRLDQLLNMFIRPLCGVMAVTAL